MKSQSAKAASVTSGRQLRITQRSRTDDFGLPPTGPAEAEPHRGAHRVIEAFVRRRLKSPVGQETFRCATEVLRRPIYTLHAGTDRGATWHEWDNPAGLVAGGVALDIVWLLGARPNHDYESLCSLGDDLLPAKVDYDELFDAARLTFAHTIISEVPKTRRDALANPGRIRTAVVAGVIHVRLFCDADASAQLLTVAVTMRPLPGPIAVSGHWVERLVLAFFPFYPEHVDVVDRIGPSPVGAGEFAVIGFADPN